MVMPPLALGGREGRMVRLCARRRERSAGGGIHREVVRSGSVSGDGGSQAVGQSLKVQQVTLLPNVSSLLA